MSDFIIQPLVILSISDHYTRYRYIEKNKNLWVVGALLGIKSASQIKIYNSFETKFN